MDEATQKKIDGMQAEIDQNRRDFETFVLHLHSGNESTKIKFQDLDTIFFKQETIDPVSLVDGAGETIQVTEVKGATLGDFVLVSAPYDLQDITVTAYVQANDIVEIRLQNESTATVDLASGIWRILVIRKII